MLTLLHKFIEKSLLIYETSGRIEKKFHARDASSGAINADIGD